MSYRPYSGPTWPTAKRKSHNRKRGRGLKLTRTPEIHPTPPYQLTKETP